MCFSPCITFGAFCSKFVLVDKRYKYRNFLNEYGHKAEQHIKADHYRPTSCLSNEIVITKDTLFHLNMSIKLHLQEGDSYLNVKAMCYFT